MAPTEDRSSHASDMPGRPAGTSTWKVVDCDVLIREMALAFKKSGLPWNRTVGDVHIGGEQDQPGFGSKENHMFETTTRPVARSAC